MAENVAPSRPGALPSPAQSEDSGSTLRPAPSVAEIFLAFARVSLMAFGGVLPWARRMVVEQRRWLTADEFNETFALCQFLPGPNIINFSVVFGARCAGARGAMAGFFGVIGPPVVIAITLASLYARFGEAPALRRILTGLAASAAGLVIAVTVKMAEPAFRRRAGPAPLVAIAVFAAIGVMHWPLQWVLLVATPASLGLAWWWMR